MKFLVPNYSCLQNPWLGGYRQQIPVPSVLNWICWPPPKQNSRVRHWWWPLAFRKFSLLFGSQMFWAPVGCESGCCWVWTSAETPAEASANLALFCPLHGNTNAVVFCAHEIKGARLLCWHTVGDQSHAPAPLPPGKRPGTHCTEH